MSRLKRVLNALNRHSEYGEIGLELALEELHMVQLCRVGENIEVVAHCSVPYPQGTSSILSDGDALASVVSAGLKGADFVGRKAVLAMPSTLTQVMPVSYQTSDTRDDDAAIGQLMRERIGDSISEFVIDYMPVQTLYEGRQKLALVAICREETVVSLLERMRNAGLDIVALEIGPIALRRLVAILQRRGPLQNTLIVNCGRDKSYLTLLSDNRLLADDEVDFGEEMLMQKICSTLDMSHEIARRLIHTINLDPEHVYDDPETARNAEALTQIIKPLLARLAKEMQRGLVYAQSEARGSRHSQVYLHGSIARWSGAAELLASLVQTPVAITPSPFEIAGVKSGQVDPAPELAVATGLALRKFMQHG